MKIKRNSFDKHGFCSLAAVSWEGLSPVWLAETELRAQVVMDKLHQSLLG